MACNMMRELYKDPKYIRWPCGMGMAIRAFVTPNLLTLQTTINQSRSPLLGRVDVSNEGCKGCLKRDSVHLHRHRSEIRLM